MLQRQINIGHCLGFDALGSVNNQQRPLASSQGTGNFIIKVNMAGSIDQIELIFLTIISMIDNTHRFELDGDAAFLL